MQLGQRVERHHGENVVLNVLVHVHIQEPRYGIHVHCARIQAVVAFILRQSRMLRQAAQEVMPSAIETRQHDEHQRQ